MGNVKNVYVDNYVEMVDLYAIFRLAEHEIAGNMHKKSEQETARFLMIKIDNYVNLLSGLRELK